MDKYLVPLSVLWVVLSIFIGAILYVQPAAQNPTKDADVAANMVNQEIERGEDYNKTFVSTPLIKEVSVFVSGTESVVE